MNKDNKKMLVPKLRFPEFRDAGEWDVKLLGECLDYNQPTAYLVSDTKYSDAYETPVLTAGKTFILGYTNEQHGIFKDKLPVIIFDDFTTATQFVDFPFKAKSSAMKILQATDGTSIKFMYELMQVIAYDVGVHERHWISKFAPMSVLIPNSKEQQKIADCLSSIDELISAQSQKLEALKTHKKGLMQQLFPREGETIPRLRFPEFRDEGEWGRYQLSKLTTKISDGIHSTPIYDEAGKYAFINGNNLVNGRILIDEKTKRVNFEEFTKHKKPLDDNSILMSINGTIGNLAFYSHERVVLGKSACFINVNTRLIDKFFIYNLLQTEQVKFYFNSELTGSTIKNLSLATIKNAELHIPSLPEQQKIASCLSSIDDLITAQSQEVEVLKTHKKGLLQQLFPAIDEVMV